MDQPFRSPQEHGSAIGSKYNPTRSGTRSSKEASRACRYHSPHCTSRRQNRDGGHRFHWHWSGRNRETRQGDAEGLWCRRHGQRGTDRNSRRPARIRCPYPGQCRFSAGVGWRMRGLSRVNHFRRLTSSLDHVTGGIMIRTWRASASPIRGYHHEKCGDDHRRDHVDHQGRSV